MYSTVRARHFSSFSSHSGDGGWGAAALMAVYSSDTLLHPEHVIDAGVVGALPSGHLMVHFFGSLGGPTAGAPAAGNAGQS